MIPSPVGRLFLAILAALHFVAAPCVMAMTAPAGGDSCEHCHTAADVAACMTTAVDPAGDDGAPAPARHQTPDAPQVVALLLPRVAPGAGALERASPARHIGFRTGRHAGDPPLILFYGKFLN